jgi:hypothetical protein
LTFADAVPWKTLDLPDRLARLWGVHEKAAVAALVESDRLKGRTRRLGDAVIKKTAEVADAQVVRAVASEAPQLALELLLVNPQPLATEDLWAPAAAWHAKLLDGLAETNISVPADPFARVAKAKLVQQALEQGLLSVGEVAGVLASEGATDLALLRWEEVFKTRAKEALHTTTETSNAAWDQLALAVASSAGTGRPQHLTARMAAELVSHFDEMGETVRLTVAAAVFCEALRGRINRVAAARSFAVLHRASARKEFSPHALRTLEPCLPSAPPSLPARLRAALLELIADEDWKPEDIARALQDAGPGAQRVRELTPKKSELRKLVNSGVRLVGEAVTALKRP